MMEFAADTRVPQVFDIELNGRFIVRRYDIGGDLRTTAIASCKVEFETDAAGLMVGHLIDLALEWPVLLDGQIPLALIMSGSVVAVSGRRVIVNVAKHEFRTRASALSPPSGSFRALGAADRLM